MFGRKGGSITVIFRFITPRLLVITPRQLNNHPFSRFQIFLLRPWLCDTCDRPDNWFVHFVTGPRHTRNKLKQILASAASSSAGEDQSGAGWELKLEPLQSSCVPFNFLPDTSLGDRRWDRRLGWETRATLQTKQIVAPCQWRFIKNSKIEQKHPEGQCQSSDVLPSYVRQRQSRQWMGDTAETMHCG